MLNSGLIDVLLSKFDMERFLEDRGYSFKDIGGATGFFFSTCPNPNCQKEWHCGINFEKQWFGCYKCHANGDFIKLLMLVLQVDYFDVLELLKKDLESQHISIRYISNIISEGKKVEELEKKIKPIALPPGYISLYNKEIDYTKSRKIPQDQINYYRMGVCYEGPYKNRLIVCDVNDKQEVIYWVARDITGKVPKNMKLLNPSSLTTGGIGSADLLFNWYLTKNYSCAILTEGVFDALWIGNNGLASYGKGLKHNHIPWLLKARFEVVYLMYDSDVRDDELEKDALLLAQFIPTKIVKLPKGDPDECSKEELQKFISEAKFFEGGTRLTHIEIPLRNDIAC